MRVGCSISHNRGFRRLVQRARERFTVITLYRAHIHKHWGWRISSLLTYATYLPTLYQTALCMALCTKRCPWWNPQTDYRRSPWLVYRRTCTLTIPEFCGGRIGNVVEVPASSMASPLFWEHPHGVVKSPKRKRQRIFWQGRVPMQHS